MTKQRSFGRFPLTRTLLGCVLHVATSALANGAADVPTVSITRTSPKGGKEGVELSCPRPTLPLTVTASVGPVGATAESECSVTERTAKETKTHTVKRKRVAEAIERFFARYPKSRTTEAGVVIDAPADAVFTWDVVAGGRRASGGYGIIDVNRADADKEAIFESLVRLQKDIAAK